MKGNANDLRSLQTKKFISVLQLCLPVSLTISFSIFFSRLLLFFSDPQFFLEKMYFKKIQKRGERERKWVREMWMRWLFVCNSLYIYLFEFASFVAPPLIVSKQDFVLSTFFFLLQYCLPNQGIYLFIHSFVYIFTLVTQKKKLFLQIVARKT